MSALFRSVPMPGGDVAILRPPAEARPALTNLIATAPADAALYRLRAQEAELALDFAAAEADWKSYAAKATDRYQGQVELADFYHRRARPSDELSALTGASAASDNPILQASAQRGWRAFERMAAIVAEESLPVASSNPVFRAWAARYPKEPAAARQLIEHLIESDQYAAAETAIANYGRTFQDDHGAVRLRAGLELRHRSPAAALAVYDRAFRPLWPDDIRTSYFKLMEEEGALRDFAGRARAALASNPADLDATARLFHHFRSQNNFAASRRVLLQYRMAKESGRLPWTAAELETAAQLFERLPDVNEAARLYYALYSLPPGNGPHVETGLAGLANLLLTAPEAPIQFGSGDLSFYKDIATVDPSPGFLNGILSVVLNNSGAHWQYQNQNDKSAAYFHRAAGTRLVALLEQRFPNSPRRDALSAAVISAYATYGDDASVIRAGREYLTAFPTGSARTKVAMQVADALSRAGRVNEEFALYDQLLRELGARASGVPIGEAPPPSAPPPGSPTVMVVPVFRGAIQQAESNEVLVRSPEYVQVLDRYIARLAGLRRAVDVLRVYRAEVDRNPNDPGLYQRLASFIEQNGVSREVEDVYRQAVAKFPDRSWYHKLARWYLRNRQSRELETVSREVIAIFSGAQLEHYFTEVVTAAHPDAALYRQLNLYAHERFPQDLVFVRNLLNAYSRQETRDATAAERLLRQYWFYDVEIRTTFFARLSEAGRLEQELAQIRSAHPAIANGQFAQAVAANPAAVHFTAEAEAWLSHFEKAAPAARALATAYPGRRDLTTQASSLYRSLAAYDSRNTAIALTLAEYEQKADPRNTEILARLGDILADRELFTRARTYWDRMPAARASNPEAYLDTATVFWDYYRYDDALRWIAAARRKFADPTLFAYEAGAIYEGTRDYAGAIRQYVAGALDGEGAARNRLLRLLDREQTRDAVDRAVASAVAANPTREAVALRIAVLEAGRRRPELEALLVARVEAVKSADGLTYLQEAARRLGFDAIEARAAERLIGVTNDPVDRLRLTFARARLLESKKEIASAAAVVDTLYRQHPLILGVVRGAVDFHVRNQRHTPAIDILLNASKQARSDLAGQFSLEAARVATSAGQFDRARSVLSGLLASDPFRAEYLAAMADTFLQAKDDARFRQHQLATIERLKTSPLTPAERVERIAAIRRSLIPAFDRLRDAAGAADQYIEILNGYPQDEALAKEVATYALAHGQAERVLAFYRKTIADAPRDYRWPIVLGRIETATEDYPAAIADYERALRNRPDRADVVEAKARLQERLMRFADARASYARLYELSYRDPQWLIKTAELHARSGNTAEAVAALRTAIIGARSETADANFEIAERLETWRMLPEAVSFAERGASLDGSELSKSHGHAVIYARIMTRARRPEAMVTLNSADPSIRETIANTVGKIIADTYTPEEKLRLAQVLTAMPAEQRLLPFVQAAGFVDIEARWRLAAMATQSSQVDARLANLEIRRGLYAEWGRELERYATAQRGRQVEPAALTQSAAAFRSAGDVESEMRVLRAALARNALSGVLLERYLSLLASREPDQLADLARSGGSDEIRNSAVHTAISAGRAEFAYDALRARGSTLPPVWTSAYTALAGRYFDDRSPAIDTAFQDTLDTRPIGERLRAPRGPDTSVSGRVWFYYGQRYGEHLGGDAAESWLPAQVEASPLNAEAYLKLGDWYAAVGQTAQALARYDQAIELDPDRGDSHSHAARLLWGVGRRDEALARWKAAIDVFVDIQSRGIRVPEPFWGHVAATFRDIGRQHAVAELRADMTRLLTDYRQRNGDYRFNELLGPAASASLDADAGLDWIMDLARLSESPESYLYPLARLAEVKPAHRIALQRELVAIYQKREESLFGDARLYASSQATDARLNLISLLLDRGDTSAAMAEWRRITAAAAPRVEVRLAAKTGSLGALLDRLRAQPQTAPPSENLRDIATTLRREGDEKSARAVLGYVYDRDLRDGKLDAANFLGLAEVKLQEGDTPAALSLLNRMALILPDGFDTLARSAELLRAHGKRTEAAAFLQRRIQAAPWDSESKLQLATLLPAGEERDRLLAAVLSDAQVDYRVRAEAARAAGPRSGAAAGTELAVLATGRISVAAASQPYQVEARIDAALQTSDAQVKLRMWREALAIAPDDPRVRLGAVRAALAAGQDRLAIAFDESRGQNQPGGTDRAAIVESLAAAAERLDDLSTAQQYLHAAIDLRPPGERAALLQKLNAIAAEQNRRSQNAARQPSIRNVTEQDRVVRPRLAGGAR